MGPNLLGMLPLSLYRKCDSIPPISPSPHFNHDHIFYPFRRTRSDRKGGLANMKGPNLLGMLPFLFIASAIAYPRSPHRLTLITITYFIPSVVRVPIGRE